MAADDAGRQVFLNNLIRTLYHQAQRPDAANGRPDTSVRLQLARGILELPVIDEPDEIACIARQPDQFRKNYGTLNELGFSRFNTNGENWQARRSLTQPCYLAAARPDRRDRIRASYEQALTPAGDSSATALANSFLHASLEVFHDALGVALHDADRLVALFDRIRNELVTLQYHAWIPPMPDEAPVIRQECRALLQSIDNYITTEPALEAMRQRFQQAMSDWPDFAVNEEFIMNLFAGIETSVSTLLWSSRQLALYPDSQSQLRAAVMNDHPLQAVDVFVNEAMRCFPPIPFVVREVARPTELGNRRLAAGQIVIVSIIGAHYHPRYWHQPQQFDPARAEFSQEKYNKHAFIPFFQGERMCGGAKLARIELREGIRALLKNYRLAGNDTVPDYTYGLALRPAAGSLPQLTPLT